MSATLWDGKCDTCGGKYGAANGSRRCYSCWEKTFPPREDGRQNYSEALDAIRREAASRFKGAPPILSVKGLRSCRATEGDAFSYTLLVDGKPAASVRYGGDGGPTDFRFTDPLVEERVHQWCATLPPSPVPGTDHTVATSLDIVMDDVVHDMEQAKADARFGKKQAKDLQTKTLFRLKGDAPQSYRWLNVPYSLRVKESVVKRFGDKLECIINEVVQELATLNARGTK